MTDVQIATPRPYAAVVTGWVRRNARPLATFDPAAPLDDLAPLGPRVRGAAVVGVGGTTGGAHELSALTHRILRYLVEHHGIRALAIEDDWRIGRALDDHVRTGAGDPRAVLAGAWPPWRTEEVVDVVHWTRTRNEAHPDDPVRIVGLDDAALESPDEAERHMADSLVAWQERTGTRALYWGEAAHTPSATSARCTPRRARRWCSAAPAAACATTSAPPTSRWVSRSASGTCPGPCRHRRRSLRRLPWAPLVRPP